MKIIALEEHLANQEVLDAWRALPPGYQDDSLEIFDEPLIEARLADLAGERIRSMDDAGVDVQVLSLTTPGMANLKATAAVSLARRTNDLIAETVAAKPDRFEGFATLPTPDPEAAAAELRRAVETLGLKGAMIFGRVGERNMDHPSFRPLYEAAAQLRVPLYVHPQLPCRAVRDAYYTGFGPQVEVAFAGPGIGWHYETGVQLIRLILSGTLDRHPDLQFILGHWGEVVLFYLERMAFLDGASSLHRPLRDYFRQNVSYTPSGIFNHEYLRRTVKAVGVERVLFSADYPFIDAGLGGARGFLEQAELAPREKELIAHGNWERLTAR
ncbi:amidohydrolase family protein [Kitasatospora sp. NPDC052896]|uniref:amidohydrolase family protein n=1 Tax=Kitasatospora sp. NPDC052896 TaxID=3364061 RepID=UPI0037C623B6